MSYSRRRLLQCSIIIPGLLFSLITKGISGEISSEFLLGTTGMHVSVPQWDLGLAQQHCRTLSPAQSSAWSMTTEAGAIWDQKCLLCKACFRLTRTGEWGSGKLSSRTASCSSVSTGSCELEAVLPSFAFIPTWSFITQNPLTEEQRQCREIHWDSVGEPFLMEFWGGGNRAGGTWGVGTPLQLSVLPILLPDRKGSVGLDKRAKKGEEDSWAKGELTSIVDVVSDPKRFPNFNVREWEELLLARCSSAHG